MTDKTVIYIRALEKEISLLRRYVDPARADLVAAAEVTVVANTALAIETHGIAQTMPPQTLRQMTIDIGGGQSETVLIVVLHGGNRDSTVLDWHRRVMEGYLGLTINYIAAPFPHVSHGTCINQILAQTLDLPNAPDYYLFIDNDAIFLRHGILDLIHSFVCNRMTVFGHAWQSNHKPGPTGLIPHAYASQATLCFSRQLYNSIGRPDCDHWIPRSDTAEEITYRAKELGYIVALVYPSHVEEPNTPLDNGCTYGMGNTYGPNLMYHCSQVPNAKHVSSFVAKCQEVLAGKFEVVP